MVDDDDDISVKGKGRKPTDADTNAIIYEGATARQLSIMFKMDPKVVLRKVSGLVPVGNRAGTSIYSIPEAASRLVKPSYEIERYIMEMNHLDLPPLLAKEFWNGQRSRLAFEENNGDLWRTADVVRIISELFSAVRMTLLLLPDTVEREAGISREQKSVVRRVIDGVLVSGREAIVKRFKERDVIGYTDDGIFGGTGAEISGDDSADDTDAGRTGVPSATEDVDEYNGL